MAEVKKKKTSEGEEGMGWAISFVLVAAMAVAGEEECLDKPMDDAYETTCVGEHCISRFVCECTEW